MSKKATERVALPCAKTDDEIVSAHMRALAEKRWKKKNKKQRAQEQREKILRRYKRSAE